MPRIYVETSVWSHAFAKDAPESRAATLEFLRRALGAAHDLFISDVVLAEIGRAPEGLALDLLSLIEKHSPGLLELDEEAADLADRFLQLGAAPSSKVEDAQHVAIAIVNELDMLLSWNYRHLVNVRRREAFQHISALSGYYKPLHIITPPEVSDESE
jgi:predicted nucleic acid-binding protein